MHDQTPSRRASSGAAGDITTIEDEGSVEEARQAWQQMKNDMQVSET